MTNQEQQIPSEVAPHPYKPTSFSIINGKVITKESLAMEAELASLKGENFKHLEHIACMAYPALKLLSDQLWLSVDGDDPEDLRCGIAWLLEIVGDKLEDAYHNPHRTPEP
jgi:hypothetical protein